METTIPNLDQLRDEKCIPVAKGVLSDMAETMIPVDASKVVDYNPVLTKVLERSLEADLNIEMENPYIFQLLLGVFASLNKVAQTCVVIPMDDIRFGKIQKKILEIVVSANVRMGEVSEEEKDADFVPVKEQLDALFAEEKVTISELKYIMDNILESFKDVQMIFAANVEQSTSRAIAKAFKLEDITELSMKKLNNVLKGENQ